MEAGLSSQYDVLSESERAGTLTYLQKHVRDFVLQLRVKTPESQRQGTGVHSGSAVNMPTNRRSTGADMNRFLGARISEHRVVKAGEPKITQLSPCCMKTFSSTRAQLLNTSAEIRRVILELRNFLMSGSTGSNLSTQLS